MPGGKRAALDRFARGTGRKDPIPGKIRDAAFRHCASTLPVRALPCVSDLALPHATSQRRERRSDAVPSRSNHGPCANTTRSAPIASSRSAAARASSLRIRTIARR